MQLVILTLILSKVKDFSGSLQSRRRTLESNNISETVLERNVVTIGH